MKFRMVARWICAAALGSAVVVGEVAKPKALMSASLLLIACETALAKNGSGSRGNTPMDQPVVVF